MNTKIYKILTNPVFAAALLVVINIIIAVFIPMNNDEGIWSYIGRVWIQQGIPPYLSAVENKTPGIFELNALSYWLFGINVWFLRLLGIIAVVLSSLTIYFIAKQIHSHLAGIISMYIFGLTNTWGLLNGIFITHTEVFMVLFASTSILLILKGINSRKPMYWIFLSGISMGFAIAFKQIALTTTIAIMFFYFYTYKNHTISKRFIGLLLIGTGILISTFISVIPLIISGINSKEYMDGAWLILLNSGSSTSLADHLNGFMSIFVFSRFVIFYPFFLLLFWQSQLLKNRYFVGLLIWLAFDFIGVNSSGYYYGHQIRQLMPSLSIITGILTIGFFTQIFKTDLIFKKYLVLLISGIIILFLPFGSLKRGLELCFTKNNYDPDKEVGIWLKNNTAKDDFVYLVDNSSTSVLSYSDRLSSSKYINTIFITGNKERNIVFDDLNVNTPKYIVRYNNRKNQIVLGEKTKNFIYLNYILKENKYNYDILKRK